MVISTKTKLQVDNKISAKCIVFEGKKRKYLNLKKRINTIKNWRHLIKERCYACLTYIPYSVQRYYDKGNFCEICDQVLNLQSEIVILEKKIIELKTYINYYSSQENVYNKIHLKEEYEQRVRRYQMKIIRLEQSRFHPERLSTDEREKIVESIYT